MAIEKERVKATYWSRSLAEIEEVCGLLFCARTLGGEAEWRVVVVEGGSGVAQKTPDVHGRNVP